MTVLADGMLMITVVLVGLIAGAEAASLIIHSTVDRLNFAVGRIAAQAINKRMGGVMPLLMPPALIATLLSAFLFLGSTPSALLFIAGAALIVMLLITFLRLAPLNAREDRADAATPVTEWQALRGRWMRWHTGRVLCDVIALLAVSAAATLA